MWGKREVKKEGKLETIYHGVRRAATAFTSPVHTCPNTDHKVRWLGPNLPHPSDSENKPF